MNSKCLQLNFLDLAMKTTAMADDSFYFYIRFRKGSLFYKKFNLKFYLPNTCYCFNNTSTCFINIVIEITQLFPIRSNVNTI